LHLSYNKFIVHILHILQLFKQIFIKFRHNLHEIVICKTIARIILDLFKSKRKIKFLIRSRRRKLENIDIDIKKFIFKNIRI